MPGRLVRDPAGKLVLTNMVQILEWNAEVNDRAILTDGKRRRVTTLS